MFVLTFLIFVSVACLIVIFARFVSFVLFHYICGTPSLVYHRHFFFFFSLVDLSFSLELLFSLFSLHLLGPPCLLRPQNLLFLLLSFTSFVIFARFVIFVIFLIFLERLTLVVCFKHFLFSCLSLASSVTFARFVIFVLFVGSLPFSVLNFCYFCFFRLLISYLH